jgi:ubiquinol-cytochrome c reductase cytochrome c1 subunit
MRYNRLAEDLGLGEELVMQNLVFADAKIGDTMDIAMRPADAEAWLGKAPPDLTLIARSRGADWLYSYFLTFYRDEAEAGTT